MLKAETYAGATPYRGPYSVLCFSVLFELCTVWVTKKWLAQVLGFFPVGIFVWQATNE